MFALTGSNLGGQPAISLLDDLCERLSDESAITNASSQWPSKQLKLCAQHEVFRWFVPTQYNGIGSSAAEIASGYIRLASACMTTAFVISQRSAACKRIVASANEELKNKLLPKLAEGSLFTTVGLSHLTTSHRHVKKPVLEAVETPEGWILNGFCPWVTGGAYSDYLVVGASTGDQQILLAVNGKAKGVSVDPSFQLVALSASHTGRINFEQVVVPGEYVLNGPAVAVLQTSGAGSSTGGLDTSSLAIGLATAAVEFVREQSKIRSDLATKADALENELQELSNHLISIASGNDTISKEELRKSANSFALRTTQSALLAAKGAGFLADHAVGRWCREALFFLVWSCPPAVSDANLCELAGLET